ncbi:MAG: sulfur carrier protein ThiS [Kiritimatiellaeota bacterium]|nr:sulfur carrier protein ThiS [Kiritimatiellota bacterium]
MNDRIIFINGTPRPLGEAQTLAQLFAALGVNTSQKAIELNGGIIRAAALASTPATPGDRIEVIQFVGGG